MAESLYEGRSILVLGGSSGIGLEAVATFKELGAENVYMGTRSEENYTKALMFLQRRRKLGDISGIHPFVADVTNMQQLEGAAKTLRAAGSLSSVIFSQASGMEEFTQELFSRYIDPIVDNYTFDTSLDQLDKEKQETVREQLALMRQELRVWTESALPRARAINYYGTFQALRILADNFPDGFTSVFYNSTWGHLKYVETPLLYRPVASSKAMVREELNRVAPQLAKIGLPIGVVVASLVNDTKVGKMFNDFLLNLMTREQREAVVNSSIYARDVIRATIEILESNPRNWHAYPKVMFVYGKNGETVIGDHLEMSAMYTTRYLF